jgi:hypothetical protein
VIASGEAADPDIPVLKEAKAEYAKLKLFSIRLLHIARGTTLPWTRSAARGIQTYKLAFVGFAAIRTVIRADWTGARIGRDFQPIPENRVQSVHCVHSLSNCPAYASPACSLMTLRASLSSRIPANLECRR